jgi:hypothetical protein
MKTGGGGGVFANLTCELQPNTQLSRELEAAAVNEKFSTYFIAPESNTPPNAEPGSSSYSQFQYEPL